MYELKIYVFKGTVGVKEFFRHIVFQKENCQFTCGKRELSFKKARILFIGAANLPRLSVSFDGVFNGCKLGKSHRAACVELLGGDADLRAEAELTAVGKPR